MSAIHPITKVTSVLDTYHQNSMQKIKTNQQYFNVGSFISC